MDLPSGGRCKQASPVAQEHRNEVDQDLGDQSFVKTLPDHARAHHEEVLAAGGCGRGGDGLPDVAGKKPDLLVLFALGRSVRQNELGKTESPASDSAYLGSFRFPAHFEGPSASQHRTGAVEHLPRLFVGRVRRTGMFEHLVHRIIGTGDKTVQRHRHVHQHNSHARLAELEL